MTGCLLDRRTDMRPRYLPDFGALVKLGMGRQEATLFLGQKPWFFLQVSQKTMVF
jgi:hypothetical protein